jgi:hypothetical protein
MTFNARPATSASSSISSGFRPHTLVAEGLNYSSFHSRGGHQYTLQGSGLPCSKRSVFQVCEILSRRKWRKAEGRGARQTRPSVCVFQGSTKLSPVNHLVDGILVLVQQGSNAKREVIAARKLKDWTKFTTQNNQKQKRKSRFYRDNFVLPFSNYN